MVVMELEVSVYVLPHRPPNPPRAMLLTKIGDAPEGPAFDTGTVAVWSRDSAAWYVDGLPLDGQTSELITQHAKDLGVPW